MKRMNRIVPGLLYILMLIAAACGDGDQSPVSTAKSMFGGLNKTDHSAWTRAFCDSSLADLMSTSTSAASDMHYTERNRRGETAEVEVTGVLGMDPSGQLVQIVWILQMQKRGGGWCVSGIQAASVFCPTCRLSKL